MSDRLGDTTMAGTVQFRDRKRRRFLITLESILMSRRLTMGAKMVYQHLSHYARQSGSCFPGQARLARHLPAGVRTVRKWLRELEAAGLITTERCGLRKTNRYWIESLTDELIAWLESDPRAERSARAAYGVCPAHGGAYSAAPRAGRVLLIVRGRASPAVVPCPLGAGWACGPAEQASQWPPSRSQRTSRGPAAK